MKLIYSILLLMLVVPLVSSQTYVYDNFDDNFVNPSLWSNISTGSGTYESDEINNQIRSMVYKTTSSDATYNTHTDNWLSRSDYQTFGGNSSFNVHIYLEHLGGSSCSGSGSFNIYGAETGSNYSYTSVTGPFALSYNDTIEMFWNGTRFITYVDGNIGNNFAGSDNRIGLYTTGGGGAGCTQARSNIFLEPLNFTLKNSNNVSFIYPENNGIYLNNSGNFNFTLKTPSTGGTNFDLVNYTFYLWNEDGNIINETFVSGLSGNSHSDTLTGFEETNGTYYWNIFTCNTQDCSFSEFNNTINFNPYISFSVVDEAGDAITTSNISIDIINYSSINNPMSDLRLSDFGGNFNHSFSFFDLIFKYQDSVTSLNPYSFLSYVLTASANQLSFSFFQDSVPIAINGTVNGINETFGFSDSSVVIVQTNLSEGKVLAVFNDDGIGAGNHTQYYEYINDFSAVFENFAILKTADVTTYVKIQDTTGAPIEDAIVRLLLNEPVDSVEGNYSLISQRLTDSEGMTRFYSDFGTTVKFQVIADGYGFVQTLSIGGEQSDAYTIDNPYTIQLESTSNFGDQNVMFRFSPDKYFGNLTDKIYGTVIALDKNLVQYNTTYNGALKKLSPDSEGYRDFTLSRGTHFTFESFTLYLYVDGVLDKSIAFNYDPNGIESSLDLSSYGLEDNILLPLGIFFLIFSAFVTGTFFKNGGKHTFMVGSICLLLVSSGFKWLSIGSATYYALAGIRRVYTD